MKYWSNSISESSSVSLLVALVTNREKQRVFFLMSANVVYCCLQIYSAFLIVSSNPLYIICLLDWIGSEWSAHLKEVVLMQVYSG